MSAPTATTDAVVHAFLDEFTEDTRQYYAPGSREWEYDGNDWTRNATSTRFRYTTSRTGMARLLGYLCDELRLLGYLSRIKVGGMWFYQASDHLIELLHARFLFDPPNEFSTERLAWVRIREGFAPEMVVVFARRLKLHALLETLADE